ncbi:winged helix-turn-helix domain-containing protein [Streptomyces sp. NRRL S-350]|uniref:winged helix-turn-helix domain-containing protein n=1 Tax=Streptomyces sp. NRRL S-350 TaxID=1463902 RepID=UPI00068F2F95|nr:winged helix-turn-helix domain-containing protein [Streptomyces sp. NRRL S-350]
MSNTPEHPAPAERPWPLGPNPGGEVVLDARSLRGLAHPLRVKLLGLLRSDGPATVTRLAECAGVSTASASYHVRQLAAYGFAEPDPRPAGRERWWRAAHQTTRLHTEDFADVESAALAGAYLQSVADYYAEQTRAAVAEMHLLPTDWREASSTSDFALRLTSDQLSSLVADLFEVIGRYHRDDPDAAGEDPETAPVVLQLQAFPRPGALTGPPPGRPSADRPAAQSDPPSVQASPHRPE